METFKIHNEKSGPADSRPILSAIRTALGYIPNLMGTLANSATAMDTMAKVDAAVAQTEFTATERQVIQLAISVVNGSPYCVAGHSAFSARQEIPNSVVQAVRNSLEIEDAKLETVRVFATAIVVKRGHVSAEDKAAFLAAGYSESHILDLVVLCAAKVMTNFASSALRVPLDDEFSKYCWIKDHKRCAA